jgi:transposase
VHRGRRGARGAGQRADHGPRAAAPGVAATKQSLHASEQDTERVQQARASSREEVATLAPQRFKFIDESGGNRAMTRLYGRAPRGERVIGAGPQDYGAKVTRLASLGSPGIEARMPIAGATDTEVFRVYVEPVLRPTRHRGDIGIMDNLRAHKAAGLREAIAQTGARLLHWPPSSPERSPIERCWAKLKTSLRKAQARTRDALDAAITEALVTVTEAEAHGWFAYSGYA